jgi:hypothetical protein
MTTNPNRFFYGFSLNYGNSSSHFRHFIIERVSRMEDYYFNEERVGEPYYVVYGSLKIDFKESSKFVASFESLNQAINLVEHLTGNPVTETDLPVYRPSDEN